MPTMCANPKCQGVRRVARYYMGWVAPNGKRMSGMVCHSCDRDLGRSNIQRWRHCSRVEAVDFDLVLDRTAREEDARDGVLWMYT